MEEEERVFLFLTPFNLSSNTKYLPRQDDNTRARDRLLSITGTGPPVRPQVSDYVTWAQLHIKTS
jgi:hypothetical protein